MIFRYTFFIYLIFCCGISSADQSVLHGNASFVGQMSCKLLDQSVIQLDEGKSQEYSSADNFLTEGDEIDISYSTNDSGAFRFDIGKSYRTGSQSVYYGIIGRSMGPSEFEGFGFESDFGKKPGLRFASNDFPYNSVLFFNQDIIFFSSKLGTVMLERYYKSDWHGLFADVSIENRMTHQMSFDCRHNVDRMNLIFEAFKKYPS